MENEKPTYEQIEKELNEYKELLWQLSDEYKLNLGNAEKMLEEEKAKYIELEDKVGQQVITLPSETEQIKSDEPSNYLSWMGLPACIFDNSGKILSHNNKFKFLVELLSFEIEELQNISSLFNINKLDDLAGRFKNYLAKEESLLQSLYRVENPFQGQVNLVVRIYKIDEGDKHLALFVEIIKNEISELCKGQQTIQVEEKEVVIEKNNDHELSEFDLLKMEIAIFSEKYELLESIVKSPEFSSDKNEISTSLLISVKRSFGLDVTRNRILERLRSQYKSFLFNINHKYPELTTNEEKHCMLIKAGLTYKEIAAIMGVSVNGVKIARNRLRKKLDLENDTKTSDFIDMIH